MCLQHHESELLVMHDVSGSQREAAEKRRTSQKSQEPSVRNDRGGQSRCSVTFVRSGDLCSAVRGHWKLSISSAVNGSRSFLANVNSRLRSLYAIARPSVCRLSVVCLSVTLVHPTQAVQIFGNISTAFGTLAIR